MSLSRSGFQSWLGGNNFPYWSYCNTLASEKIALRSLFDDPDWEFTDISGISPSCLDRAEAYGLGHKFRPHP